MWLQHHQAHRSFGDFITIQNGTTYKMGVVIILDQWSNEPNIRIFRFWLFRTVFIYNTSQICSAHFSRTNSEVGTAPLQTAIDPNINCFCVCVFVVRTTFRSNMLPIH